MNRCTCLTGTGLQCKRKTNNKFCWQHKNCKTSLEKPPAKAKPKPQAKSNSPTKPKPQAKPKSQTNPKSEAKPKPQAKSKSEDKKSLAIDKIKVTNPNDPDTPVEFRNFTPMKYEYDSSNGDQWTFYIKDTGTFYLAIAHVLPDFVKRLKRLTITGKTSTTKEMAEHSLPLKTADIINDIQKMQAKEVSITDWRYVPNTFIFRLV